MYFRFGVALLLVVAISVAGVAIEKMTLATKRDMSRQQYRLEVLRDEHARMRLRTQELGAPTRMVKSIRSGELKVERPKRRPKAAKQTPKRPLLHWQAPVREVP